MCVMYMYTCITDTLGYALCMEESGLPAGHGLLLAAQNIESC